ncbi:unnamed protein product [Rotaria magnacalcarata]|nr:unnamed protein product [Rotaria magnacalcarata]CAF3771597.1 unnamed protein product [Rotaria magnacalcarata]CAF3802312.1 unnamed protein product [Rotaria magnacalcarata]CAF3832844.1 unnamed protein product [Rotaria magnacalcarata]CAF4140139.1 unnamed protein product [Rotaria magnacalcarata]
MLNIFIFSTVSSYHQIPSTFYLWCTVIANFIHLTIAMTSRSLMMGYGYDLTPLTLDSFATFDQFLITSRSVRLRNFSSFKKTHRITVGFVIFWHIHTIPFLVYNQIQLDICIISNQLLAIYWSYIFFFAVLLAIPTVTLVTFSFLTYKNLHRLTNIGQLVGSDQQLVKIICLPLTLVVMATIPFGIYNAYILATSSNYKNAEQIDRDFLFLTVTSLMGLFNFGVRSFYIFIVASSRFRRVVRERLFSCRKNSNDIRPTTICPNKPP